MRKGAVGSGGYGKERKLMGYGSESNRHVRI